MTVCFQTTWSPEPLIEHQSVSTNTFLAIPQAPTTKENIAVSYLGSSHSTIHEIYEETLYLSQLLTLEVIGIQVQSPLCWRRSNDDDVAVSSLLTTWQTFFNKNPSGSFIQYFFGDSVYVIERALVLFNPSSSQTLTFIGVNPSRCPFFPCQLIQDSIHSRLLCKNYSSLSLSTSPYTHSVFFKRFNDSTFSSALVAAFLEITGIDNSSNLPISDHLAVPSEITYTLELAPPPSRTTR